MTCRARWAAFLVCCAAGWAGFLLLYPRFDIAATEWKTKAARADVIRAAQQLAKGYGIDTAGWDFYVTAQSIRARRFARLERPLSLVLAQFPTMMYTVETVKPGTLFRVQAILTSDLRPLGFRTYGPRYRPNGKGPDGKGPNARGRGDRGSGGPRPGGRPPFGGPPPPDFIPPGNQASVDIASQLSRYAGANAPRYRQTAFAIPTPEGLRSAWEWTEPGDPGILARLQIFVRRGEVNRVDHDIEIADSLIAARQSEFELPQSLANPARQLFIALTLFFCCWYFFRSLAHTFVPLRFAFVLVPLLLLPLLADFLLGPDRDRSIITATRTNTTSSATLTFGIVGIGLICAGFVVVFAAGRSIVPVPERLRWLPLQCLYLRKYFARPIGRDLLAGLAAGPLISSIPLLLVLALGRPGLFAMTTGTPMFLSTAHPWAGMLGDASPYVQLAAFGFVWPWAIRLRPSSWLPAAILALYGVAAIFLFIDPVPGSRLLSLAGSLLVFLALWFIYRQCGLLGVWASSFSASAAAMSLCFLLNGLRAEALSAAGPLIVIAVAGAGIALLGSREDQSALVDSFEIQPREHIVNERARLDAEFSIATAAQQRLLPSAPPPAPGYSLAGSCTPAREVGGDLFDYNTLPGGQLGLCVADVSGKGVPAALYMTLTKGMLSSAQPKRLPLPILASRLNRHLLATGRRKTFVTMSLAVLDVTSRRLTHVRAGHNPPLLYRAATRSWQLLKPRGLGLGLASPAAFDRILEEESVDLEPGDIAVLYSDGLTEMMNPNRDLFGEERLAEAVTTNAHRDAQAIHDAILDAARQFQSGAEQHDDLTLLVLKTDLSLT